MRRRQFLETAALTGLFGATALLAERRVLGSPDDSTGAVPDHPPADRGLLANADETNARAIPGLLMHFLVRPQDTGGTFALIEARGRKGMEPGPHVHEREDEIVRLHDGRIRFRVGAEDLEAGPGDVVFLPRRVPHVFELLTETVHADLILTPGGFADYFWQFSQPAASLEIPPAATAPPPAEAMEVMMAAMARYGISPAEL